jgi:TolB-like protein
LICSDKPVSPAKGILPGKGIENLTELNLQINESLGTIHPKRLALDILSDILLRHKALQTRKWLNELLERLRGRGVTTLAVLNPHMHTAEETQALEDVFDASMEVFQREVEGRRGKFLRINWAHGVEASQGEFPLEGLVAEKRSESRSELEKTRLAVLPFANMSPDPNDQYFADGITEEIISIVSGISGLSVISRTSVMSYKGTTKKLGEIGRELDVGSILEGSVRKAGNRIRITAQLIDVVGDRHLWAQNYDRNFDDIFAVQSEIAEKVAGELKIRLVDSDKRVIEKKATENTEAYNNFLRGREMLREQTEPSLKQAIDLFEKAIELDPSFAKAYVGIAECHQLLADGGFELADISVATVRPLLERALGLDPNLPEAHAALSVMFFNVDDVLASEAEARRALELNPSLPDTYWHLFELAAHKGDSGEMVRQIESAYRLDPIRPDFIYRVGIAYFWTGRGQEALEFWRKNEHLAPAFVYRGMTEFYIANGDLQRAKEFNAKLERLDPTNPRAIWMGGVIAAMEGDRDKALVAVKKIEDAKMGPVGFNFIGYVYHALGDLDSFFECMNKALEGHAMIGSILLYSPLWAKARTDPRYQELTEKLRKQTGITK